MITNIWLNINFDHMWEKLHLSLSYLLLLKTKDGACQTWWPLSQWMLNCLIYFLSGLLNVFHIAGLFLYPQKKLGNLCLSDALKGHRKRPVAWNRFYALFKYAKKLNYSSCSKYYFSPIDLGWRDSNHALCRI